MKRTTINSLILLILTLSFQSFVSSSKAQAPQRMSYQAVVRNSSNKLVVNQKVRMRISILRGSENGTTVYTETQIDTTNSNGLVTVEIGSGTTTDNFSAIDWANGKYFIKTETDPSGGTSYTIPGISQLLSVPYAFYAQTSGSGTDADTDPTNEIQTISKTGNTVTLSKSGGSVSVDDADADPANEIQTLSISGTNLSLSRGGGTVPLPSSTGGADNWGTQTAAVDATLSGNGTTATPLKIAQQSATNGQALKWNGTTWKPGKVDADSTNELQVLSLNGNNLILSKNGGSVTLPTTGGTGGDNWGTQTAVTDVTLGGNGTPTSPLTIAQQAATNGQVLKWNGSNWTPGDDASGGGGGLTLPYSGSTDNSNSLYALDITSTNRSGIRGISSTSESGPRYGVTGEASGTQGRGVWGVAFSTSGSTCGVKGVSYSDSGIGTHGLNANEAGINYGIYGESLSPSGFGVYGLAPMCGIKGEVSGSGEAGYGVYGKNAKIFGVGVYGEASFIGVKGIGSTGVNGVTTDPSGFGVYGYGDSENSIGVNGSGGTGVKGRGSKFGVVGESAFETGYSAHFSGGRFYVDGNAGFGILDPAYKLDVAGAANLNSGGGVDPVALLCNGREALWSNGTSFSWGYGNDYNFFAKPVVIGGTNESPNVFLKVNNPSGYGIESTSSLDAISGYSTNGMGVYGNSSSPSGAGLYGEGTHVGIKAFGNVYGIHAECPMSGGYAGYFSGRVLVTDVLGVGVDPNCKLDVGGQANLNSGISNGTALSCNGNEAIWYNGDYFSWGFGGNWNFFGDRVFIGPEAIDPGTNLLVVNGEAAKPGSPDWATWSDIRLKDIQGSYDKGLKEIILLQPVRYNYKKDNACKLLSDKSYTGFIAQDVQKVFPEAITEGSDGYLTLDVNSINVALVNAVKELKAENDELKVRLTKLEKLMEAASQK